MVKNYGAALTVLLAHAVIPRVAGQWRGWPVPHGLDGRDCWCGRNICLNYFLWLGGLETEYHNITQTRLGIKAIAAAADAGNQIVASVFQVLDDRIGRATAMIINYIDSDVIILSGRLAGLDRLYQHALRKWPRYLLVKRKETKLQKASQTVFTFAKGSACLAIEPAIDPSMAITINN